MTRKQREKYIARAIVSAACLGFAVYFTPVALVIGAIAIAVHHKAT